MVESKSLKLLSLQFPQPRGLSDEDCVNIIMKDLIRLMDPKYIEVWGKFTPREESQSILTATTGGRGTRLAGGGRTPADVP